MPEAVVEKKQAQTMVTGENRAEFMENKLDLQPAARNYDVLAYAYFRLGQREKACAFLEEGLKRHPDDEELAQRLKKCRGQ